MTFADAVRTIHELETQGRALCVRIDKARRDAWDLLVAKPDPEHDSEFLVGDLLVTARAHGSVLGTVTVRRIRPLNEVEFITDN